VNASDYDDGFFDLLKERLEGGIEVKAFSTAFSKAGVYVFVDSQAIKQGNRSVDAPQSIVKVMDPPDGVRVGDKFSL